jgi:hypothetical protein
MRSIALALATTATVLAGLSAAEARTPPRPWCLMEGGGPPSCLYHNFNQCYQSSRGVGGTCIQNPRLWGRSDRSRGRWSYY